ncbi:MAG: 5'-methylthioadenosine phosphorylase [Myxococcota bacterium]
MPACVILGSAFADALGDWSLIPRTVKTPLGPVVLHSDPRSGGFILFRHGLPHRLLPNQIPYRAHALALRAVGCQSLLVTSSVGVLDDDVALFTPYLLGDLLMLDNRLPDGSACTLFTEPSPRQGHLVVEQSLFDVALSDWIARRCALSPRRLTFLYVPGPRTKTAAENRLARSTGAEVNSMTLAPEVVLANELEIPTAALVIGHKRSGSRPTSAEPEVDLAGSLDRSRAASLAVISTFLSEAPATPFANRIYRFDHKSP